MKKVNNFIPRFSINSKKDYFVSNLINLNLCLIIQLFKINSIKHKTVLISQLVKKTNLTNLFNLVNHQIVSINLIVIIKQ
jgi:hypothetical protein